MKSIPTFFLLFSFFTVFGQLSVQNLKTENLTNPIGLVENNPRFNWQLKSEKKNVMQTAYEIKVFSGKKEIWNSGKRNSDQSIWVKYAGMPLKSNKKYNWQVRVWDNHGEISEWSEKAFFQTAFLNKSDWTAKWIEPGFTEKEERPSPIFRKEFNAGKKIKKATLFITAHGLYEAYLNGKRIGDAYLTPGWTSYNKRLQYQVYDVTDHLKSGRNAVGVTLGSGWYRGELGWVNHKNIYGDDIALLFQLEIEYSNGKKEIIISDNSWKTNTGEIQYSEIYHGEIIDAREEKSGWLEINYNDTKWPNAKETDHSFDVLLATYNEPIKKQETFKPKKIIKTPNGETVLDFGQNLVGWVMVKATGRSGDKIILSHNEVLDKEGNFYIENLRHAKQKNTYILKGGTAEFFEPHFTWQGFRYVRVDEYPGEINPENFTAVALYSDMNPVGQFSSSNELINQLQHNIQWGQRGNFLDVPTDCPQRDERMGWTGDAQAFSRTATFNFDVHNFFTKWLRDLEADQTEAGRVPFVVPHVLGQNAGGAAGWADAATIIPWNMYLIYGDKKILENQYESMKNWVRYMTDNSTGHLWNKGFHFGDWLFYSVNDDRDGKSAITNKYYIAQCFYAHSTEILQRTAELLGKKEDAKKYADLLQAIKKAFLNEYITSNGATMSNTQTSYVLALQFDLLPENLRQQAADRLAKNVELYDKHLTTGFLGTPYLCHVLSRYGHTELAFELLMQKTYPSWLYPVTMGATTIWERWDGIKPDSTFQNPTMNSFNHYAYGAIGDWMYRVVAGIDIEEGSTAYKKSVIKPHLGGDFKHINASLETVYGIISSQWKIEKGQFILDVEIPHNTSATVFIPAPSVGDVSENGNPLSGNDQIKLKGENNGYVEVEVGSGSYQFNSKLH